MSNLKICLFILLSALFFIGCEKQSLIDQSIPFSDEQENSAYTITFDEPLSLKDFTKMNEEISTKMLLVRTEFEYNGETISGQIPLDGNLKNGKDILRESLQEFNLIMKKIENDINSSSNNRKQVHITQDGTIDMQKVHISEITLEIISSELKKLESFLNKKSITPHITSLEKLQEIKPNVNRTPSQNRSVKSSWIPDNGLVYASDWNNGDRILYNTINWTSKTPFGLYSTYEHDLFCYNYDNERQQAWKGTYLTRSQSRWGIPKLSYYSNLPSSYLDTRFADNSGEVSYTVGSGDALLISNKKEYYTMLVGDKGDADYDQAKLVAQLGEQIPPECKSTWCSFATENKKLVSGFWSIDLPGITYW